MRLAGPLRILGTLRLLTLPPSELPAVARAQFALLRARRTVRGRPEGELVEVWGPEAAEASSDDIARLERAVALAARHGVFRPSCLVRSVALAELVRRDGHSGSAVKVGVRWSDGEFRAHARVDSSQETRIRVRAP